MASTSIPEDFDPIEYINTPRWQASRLGLDRIRELLERLGRPQDRLRVVHVAGTNGKGSTCAYLANVLQAAGLRVGWFSSPFIEQFEERIRVNGANISRDDLVRVTWQVRRQAEAMSVETGDHPTEFELMTAVALLHFAQVGCNVVVLEVGLGGRLDSTNVIDGPEVAVITRIGLDHTEWLGDTVGKIAGEKAGIVKPGSAVVSWPQEPEAAEVVRAAARAAGDPLTWPDFEQLQVLPVEHGKQTVPTELDEARAPGRGAASARRDALASGEGPRGVAVGKVAEDAVEAEAPAVRGGVPVRPFVYKGKRYETALLGSYQPQNAALALEAVEALRSRGWDVPQEAVVAGVAATRWPGRFEVLPRVEGRPTVVVDGGHNPQGAQALADSLVDVFAGRKVVLVSGVMADKDHPAMLRTVLPCAAAFVAVTPDNPRALPAAEYAAEAARIAVQLPDVPDGLPTIAAETYDEAVARAERFAGPDGIVCAFGSLYSIHQVKAALRGAGMIV